MKRLLTILTLLICYVVMLPAQRDSMAHITHFSEADGYEQSIVNHAIQDSRGYIWLCTWNGLQRYDGYRFRNYKARPGDNSPLRANRISTVRELKDGRMECTTPDSMTYVLDVPTGRFAKTNGDYAKRPRPYKPDTATVWKVKQLPAFRNVYTRILCVDRQGGIWVDTHSGLYRIWYSAGPLKPHKLGQDAEEEVRALYVDRQGRVWLADKNGYVRMFSSWGTAPLYLTAQGRLNSVPTAMGLRVYTIFEDSRGTLWMGCKPGGLLRLTPAGSAGYTVTRYTHQQNDPYSLSCDNVYAIAEDAQDRLWIATYKGGLNMLDLRSGRDVFLNNRNGLTGWPADYATSKMHCLYITKNQVLVAGTLAGLYAAQLTDVPQQMHFVCHQMRGDDATSLSSNWVMDLQPLPGGQLAIATAGGGVCLTGQDQLLTDSIRFRTFMTDQGLASDVCESMIYVAKDSSLFIVAQTAITRLSLHDMSVTNYIRGTLADDFNLQEAKPVLTTDGHLLMGTTQGVLDLCAGDLSKSTFQPSIVFDQLSFADSSYTITLPSDQRSLTLSFAALDYNKSVPLTYAYRIEGMNDEWTYINDNRIVLPDIPAGTYRLHLRSTNGDGIWADNERVVTITRKAAFTETPYFWMLLGLLLALVAGTGIQLLRYIRRLQNEIKDVRLTSNQRIEVMSERIRELLSIHEKVEPVKEEQEAIENEEDRLFAERLKTYVKDHIADSGLSVADMAQEMAVSRTVLFARMKSVFNTSPNNYVLNQRIAHAKELLRHPNAYIADVAYRSGFSDPKYFSKCFKKLVGMTPTEFQKQ